MNAAAEPESKARSGGERFLHAWVQGWKVILLMVWLQIIGFAITLPFKFFPPNLGEAMTVVVGLILGPPLAYWGFKTLYPDPELRTASGADPFNCLSCRTPIPAHGDTCPSCGWSYKRR